MTNERTRGLAPLLLLSLVAVLLAAPSCIFDPEKADEPDPGPVVEWPDRTEKEHCLETLLRCYEDRNISYYDELLHPDFEWHLQELDAQKYGIDFWQRDEDKTVTDALFNRALHLMLEIEPASWTSVPQVGEIPCEDCWQTDRIYHIEAQIEPDGATLVGDDLIRIIIAPDVNDATKWQIKYMYDLFKE